MYLKKYIDINIIKQNKIKLYEYLKNNDTIKPLSAVT